MLRRLAALPLAMLLASPCSAFAAHPLISEDTGTQGKGGVQLEASLDAERDRQGLESFRTSTLAVTLTLGVTETVDVFVGAEGLRQTTSSELAATRSEGLGDSMVGMKWRFWESETLGLSAGMKAALALPSGNSTRGLGRAAPGPGLTAFVQHDTDAWTFLANIGVDRDAGADVGERRTRLRTSAAALYSFAPHWVALLDMGLEQAPQGGSPAAKAVGGVIYSPTDDIDLDLGYTTAMNRATADGVVQLGVTLRWP